MKQHLNLALSVLVLVTALCMAPTALATTISIDKWVTLKDYNNLDSACIMTYAVSDTQGGSILSTYDTFELNNNKNNQDDLQWTLWSLQGSADPFNGSSGRPPWAINLASYNTDISLHHSWGSQVLTIVNNEGKDLQNQLYH